jgi:hypothetical protein
MQAQCTRLPFRGRRDEWYDVWLNRGKYEGRDSGAERSAASTLTDAKPSAVRDRIVNQVSESHSN